MRRVTGLSSVCQFTLGSRACSLRINISRPYKRNLVTVPCSGVCEIHMYGIPLAFIGHASKPKPIALLKSAFSITRFEGSRWRLRRTRSVYGESTKEGFQTRLLKGLSHRGNFDISKQRILNHEAAIVQPSLRRWKPFIRAHAQRPPRQRLRSSRYPGQVNSMRGGTPPILRFRGITDK